MCIRDSYNTAAYKTNRIEQILREDGYVDGAIRTNALQGSIRISKSPYDVASDGEGYIPGSYTHLYYK